jgi:hypothetical protein
MGKGVSFDTVGNRKVVGIGNNVFEQGVISVAAGATVKAGTVLKRSGAAFAACDGTQGEVPLAVVPFDLTNGGASAASMGFRALTGGMVRKDLLALNGEAITKAQADALRDYGIVAADVTDVSRVNP